MNFLLYSWVSTQQGFSTSIAKCFKMFLSSFVPEPLTTSQRGLPSPPDDDDELELGMPSSFMLPPLLPEAVFVMIRWTQILLPNRSGWYALSPSLRRVTVKRQGGGG